MGKQWKQCQTLFLGAPKSLQIMASADDFINDFNEIKRCLLLGRNAMMNLDSIIKKQRHYFANKGPSSQSYGFSSSHLWMWELNYKESWVLKNWCFWTGYGWGIVKFRILTLYCENIHCSSSSKLRQRVTETESGRKHILEMWKSLDHNTWHCL